MAVLASRNDVNRRFLSTQNKWPTGNDRLLKFRLVKGQGDRHFPKGFLTTYGSDFGNSCFAIDHYDNCLQISLTGNPKHRVIEERTFERISKFYARERDVTVHLRYVGFGLFYLSLWDKSNIEIALVPDPNHYVRDRLCPNLLHLIEVHFNLKYTPFQEDQQPDVIIISDDSNESMHAEEVVNQHTASSPQITTIIRDVIFHTHWKVLKRSDIKASRLYMPVDFAEKLQPFGNGTIWTIIGPPSAEGNVFLFRAHQNRRNAFDIRFGLEWPKFRKAHKLKPKDILMFSILSPSKLRIRMDIDRHQKV